jgi:hypothetical protein
MNEGRAAPASETRTSRRGSAWHTARALFVHDRESHSPARPLRHYAAMLGNLVYGRGIACALLLALSPLSACGGSTQTGIGGPDGGGPLSSSCPATPPSSGGACSVSLECEYGVDPDVDCDTVATCMSGQWQIRAAPGTPCSTALGPDCPASYSALDQSMTCSPVGTACAYPEARCGCATHCDMFGRQTPFWCCDDAPPTTPACPSPRPRIGSSCTTNGTTCDYGGCTGNVALQCTSGTWQPVSVGCPG